MQYAGIYGQIKDASRIFQMEPKDFCDELHYIVDPPRIAERQAAKGQLLNMLPPSAAEADRVYVSHLIDQAIDRPGSFKSFLKRKGW